MKIKSSIAISTFVIIMLVTIISHNVMEGKLNEKITLLESQLLDDVVDLVDISINSKAERLSELSLHKVDMNNVEETIDYFGQGKNKSQRLDYYNDQIVVKLIDGTFACCYDKENKVEDLLSKEEINVIDELYNDISNSLLFKYSRKIVINNSGEGVFYLAHPLYTEKNEYVGILATGMKCSDFMKVITPIISEDFEFELKLFSDGKEFFSTEYELNDFEKLVMAGIEQTKYINSVNATILVSASKTNLFKEFYYPWIFYMIILIVSTVVFAKPLLQEKKELSFKLLFYISLAAFGVNTYSAFQFHNASTKVTNMTEYSAAYLTYENLVFNKAKNEMPSTSLMHEIYNFIDQDDSVNKNNLLNKIISEFEDELLDITKKNINLGYIYLYDGNSNATIVPNNSNMKNVTLNNKIYDEALNNIKKSCFEIVYDDNFISNMSYLMYPIVKNNEVIGIVCFVYDYENIRKEVLRQISNDVVRKYYIDEQMNVYEIKDKELIKYGEVNEAGIEKNHIVWENNNDDGLREKTFIINGKKKDYTCVVSSYLDGTITIDDPEKVSYIQLVIRSIIGIVIYTMLILAAYFITRIQGRIDRELQKVTTNKYKE